MREKHKRTFYYPNSNEQHFHFIFLSEQKRFPFPLTHSLPYSQSLDPCPRFSLGKSNPELLPWLMTQNWCKLHILLDQNSCIPAERNKMHFFSGSKGPFQRKDVQRKPFPRLPRGKYCADIFPLYFARSSAICEYVPAVPTCSLWTEKKVQIIMNL